MARERYCHIRIPEGLVNGIRNVVKLTGNRHGYRSVSEFVVAATRNKIVEEEMLYLRCKSEIEP